VTKFFNSTNFTLCWIKRDCPFAPLNCKHRSASPRVAVISPVQDWTIIGFFGCVILILLESVNFMNAWVLIVVAAQPESCKARTSVESAHLFVATFRFTKAVSDA
jgi:hypothetical protein